jgi:hypothetical protein
MGAGAEAMEGAFHDAYRIFQQKMVNNRFSAGKKPSGSKLKGAKRTKRKAKRLPQHVTGKNSTTSVLQEIKNVLKLRSEAGSEWKKEKINIPRNFMKVDEISYRTIWLSSVRIHKTHYADICNQEESDMNH